MPIIWLFAPRRQAILRYAVRRAYRQHQIRPIPCNSGTSRSHEESMMCTVFPFAKPDGLCHDSSGIYPFPCNENTYDEFRSFE